jgi:hypothetical protein
MQCNMPMIDTGWRVGQPFKQNRSLQTPIAKTTVITGIDGKNYEVTLVGYGKPEWTSVDR